MATVNPTVTDVLGDGSVMKFVWLLTQANADGAPIDSVNWGNHADRSVELVGGTFGAGGTVVWEGSNDGGTTYKTLDDASNAPMTYTTAPQMEVPQPVCERQRPRVTAGDGTTSLTVAVLARRHNPMRT
jgi:hypothetical protein